MTVRPINRLLADAVRAVNACWVSAGQPPLHELGHLWKQLEVGVDTARAAGDEVAAQRVIASYQARAIAAIEEVTR
jgi:hypothetical protein